MQPFRSSWRTSFRKILYSADYPLELSRKDKRVHMPFLLKVHYVDAQF